MRIRFTHIDMARKRPLRISRGTATSSENLFVEIEHDGITGLGEAAPIGYDSQSATRAELDIRSIARKLEELGPWQVSLIEQIARSDGLSSTSISALNCACWDWLGKKAEMPVYRLLGLQPEMPATSITLGIEPVEVIPELVRQLLSETGADCLKIKLGNPDGIEADREAYTAAIAAGGAGIHYRVDANGGWRPEEAAPMIAWLAGHSCEYVEQPLSHEHEAEFSVLKARRLPVYLDESIQVAADVPRLARHCDGVNVKLMKAGGISEAMRIVHTARAHRLGTMVGCFGESSVGISAAAAIGSLFDYIDLDSHLNLEPDPAEGCDFHRGVLTPCDTPGLGVRLK